MLEYPGLQSDPRRARSSRWGRSKDPIPLPSIFSCRRRERGFPRPPPSWLLEANPGSLVFLQSSSCEK